MNFNTKGSKGTTTLENSFKVEFETFLQQSSFLPQKLVINLVQKPVNTAKSFNAMSKNKQYTFDVDPRLTKSQIKKLFEKLFAVNIVQIQTHIPPRKKITVGNVLGSSQKVKRVIFTLKEAQTIQFDS
jgi:large subunit ribosomal protein L23